MNKQGLMQTSILKEYAKSHKYKVPTYKDFQEKCMKYFGVSLHQEAQDYEVSIDHNFDYTINELCRFIYVEVENLFYQPKIEREVTAEDAQKLLYAKENGIADKFIAYNKLLFNDDISTLSYFMRKPDEAMEVVFDLDYENNKVLLIKSIDLARSTNIFNTLIPQHKPL